MSRTFSEMSVKVQSLTGFFLLAGVRDQAGMSGLKCWNA
jgi:hypothetical protein